MVDRCIFQSRNQPQEELERIYISIIAGYVVTFSVYFNNNDNVI